MAGTGTRVLGIMASMSDPGDPNDQPSFQPRIGDAERQAAVDRLSDHYVAGRLDETEFNERMDKALRAKTAEDLAPLFADLPGDSGFGSRQVQPYAAPTGPAVPEHYGQVPDTASSGGGLSPSARATLQTIQGLIWPIAILSAIFLGVSWLPAIGGAIIITMVLDAVLKNDKKKHEPPPGDDEPPRPELPGGPNNPHS